MTPDYHPLTQMCHLSGRRFWLRVISWPAGPFCRLLLLCRFKQTTARLEIRWKNLEFRDSQRKLSYAVEGQQPKATTTITTTKRQQQQQQQQLNYVITRDSSLEWVLSEMWLHWLIKCMRRELVIEMLLMQMIQLCCWSVLCADEK